MVIYPNELIFLCFKEEIKMVFELQTIFDLGIEENEDDKCDCDFQNDEIS
jgi:hypothetical protein